MIRRNRDRRNAAGGIAEGERTVRKGGWVQLGDDLFYSPKLELYAGWRVFIGNLEDAFSPRYAECQIEALSDEWIRVYNLYHLLLRNQLPKHLEKLRPRLQ